jgi:hypothetical protein
MINTMEPIFCVSAVQMNPFTLFLNRSIGIGTAITAENALPGGRQHLEAIIPDHGDAAPQSKTYCVSRINAVKATLPDRGIPT